MGHQPAHLAAEVEGDCHGQACEALGQADHLWCRLERAGEASLLDESEDVAGGDLGIPAAREGEPEPRVQAVDCVRLAPLPLVQVSASAC